ncbi:chemotaxis protein CheB [Segetibacter aerophilus]|uniref:protein-glutamate methylesterase n=1 Tax=Segetibacter aerophilus TaxID=670293 RepID=A0A512BH73_9BACT|nr:chemotaxis protein CheB [Segetibacter aerophilus]GEO11310.1 chemotaxis protein-glutamate methylesterase [Segetibacter aerophilus]
MDKKDIIVIGASAGGVNALIDFVKGLPANLDASIFVVLHVHPSTPSNLPQILANYGPLLASHAEDGEKIKPRRIYVAPPDHHLLIENGRVLVRKGPKENRFRPSIDVLFRSAAYNYGSRVIGIVLSGMLNDGTSGMWSVKHLGGTCIVQDPEEALYESMPENVLREVDVDFSMPVSRMGKLLEELVNQNAPKMHEITPEQMELMKMEVIIASNDNAFELGILNKGELTPFTCPECHGTLISLKEGTTVRFRCHTGHAFSSSTLLAGVTQSIEEQIWSTMRTFEEAVMLLEQIAKTFQQAGNEEAAKEFFDKAEESRKRSKMMHNMVTTQELMSEDLAPAV